MDEDYIVNLPADPLEAMLVVSDSLRVQVAIKDKTPAERFKLCLPYFAILCELQNDLTNIIVIDQPVLGNQFESNLTLIHQYNQNISSQVRLELETRSTKSDIKEIDKYTELFRMHRKTSFSYDVEEDELKELQDRINNIRELIKLATCFDEGHRLRLLKKLEKLQLELHKKMSTLDGFWGLWADAGVALGKFGEDAEPLFNQVKDVLKLIAQIQGRSEGINPLNVLEHKKDDKIE